MTIALATHNVTKSYQGTPVLNGVSIEVPVGAVTGLIGPNGAGKTTLLGIIAGLRTSDSGAVTIWGLPLQQKALGDIGILLDHPGLWPFLTGRQNLHVHARLRGVASSRIDVVLQQVDLTQHADRKVSKYSLGMRWRLGIAIALLSNPAILILDEPTNGLDPVGIRDMRSLIRSMADAGHAVLVSSHQLHEISHTCDRVAVLISGNIRYQGSLDGLAQGSDLESAFFRLVEAS